MPNLVVSLTLPNPWILDRNQMSFFSISEVAAKSFINKNFHNFRTSDGIDMNLEKKNMIDVWFFKMRSCQQTTTNLEQIKKLNDDCMVHNSYSLIINGLLSNGNWTKVSLPWKMILFLPKMCVCMCVCVCVCVKKVLASAKLNRAGPYKVYSLKLELFSEFFLKVIFDLSTKSGV